MNKIILKPTEYQIIKNNWKKITKDKYSLIIYHILTKKDPKKSIFSSFHPKKDQTVYHYNYLLNLIIKMSEKSIIISLDNLLPYELQNKKKTILEEIYAVLSDIVFTLLGELNSISKFSGKRITLLKEKMNSPHFPENKKNSLYYFINILFTKKEIIKNLLNSYPKSRKKDKIFHNYYRSKNYAHSGLVKTILDQDNHFRDYRGLSVCRSLLTGNIHERVLYWIVKNKNNSPFLSLIDIYEE